MLGAFPPLAAAQTDADWDVPVTDADSVLFGLSGFGSPLEDEPLEDLDGRPSTLSQACSPAAWTLKTPMPTARSGLAVVAASDGKIYAIGGVKTRVSVGRAVAVDVRVGVQAGLPASPQRGCDTAVAVGVGVGVQAGLPASPQRACDTAVFVGVGVQAGAAAVSPQRSCDSAAASAG